MKSLIMTAILSLFMAAGTPAFAFKANDPAPSFALRDRSGGNFYFSNYIGPRKKKQVKGMILSFFASYCEPCKRELPVLNGLVDEFEKKGIMVVIVGFKEDFDKISEMLDEIRVDKPIVLSDAYGQTGRKYGVTHLPMTFFIGVDGKVKDMVRGDLPNIEKTLREKAARLLR